MIVLAALGFTLSAQPLHWTENLYDPLKTSVIEKETVLKTEGMYSMKYTYTDPGIVLYESELFAVTPGLEWNFSVDYLDNDPSGVITARVYFMINATTQVTPNSVGRFTTANTVDGASWQTLTLTGGTTFVPANATLAYVAVRMSAAAAPAWTGTATFYADNLKFTQGAGSTTNLIVNPGFENWAIAPGSTLPNWRESLYDPLLTSVLVNEPTLKTEGFNSLKYTYTDPGVVYLYSDTIHVTAGEPYNFSCDFYDNDPSGLVSTRLWFYTGVPGSAYLSRTETTRTTDMASWQTGTLSGTTPAGATIAYVGIRLAAATAPAWTGTATMYADNFIYTQGAGSTTNLIKNGGFEEWLAPTDAPEFLTYKFECITPVAVGSIDKTAHTVLLTVPYETDVTALVSTFTLTDGTAAKVSATEQVSGTTPNNFTNPVTYTLTKNTTNQDWIVTVTKPAPTTGKDIITFKFEGLTPIVTGIVDPANKTVSLEVPNATNVAALIPAITLSANATVSPLSGVAQDFTAPVTYTVKAQDGSMQAWVVTVTKTVAGQTTLFFDDFENTPRLLKPGYTIINNDNFPMAVGEERWADSCWLISTTSRPELAGTHVAMASSYVTMALTDRVERWLVLPSISLGSNSTLSWQALSTTTSGNYPDDYTVYIAPVTPGIPPTVAYFEENGNILMNVAPENWSATVGRPGAGLANRSINLKNKVTADAPSGWFDRDVYIAFAINTDLYTNPTTGVPNSSAGGSALAIDNIKVVNSVNTGLAENKLNSLGASVYPNPARNEVNVAFTIQKSGVATVSIMDLTGREIRTFTKSAGTGVNNLKMNISDLEKGVYMVRTLVNDKMSVTKLIIR
jgi:hypothetical protein